MKRYKVETGEESMYIWAWDKGHAQEIVEGLNRVGDTIYSDFKIEEVESES